MSESRKQKKTTASQSRKAENSQSKAGTVRENLALKRKANALRKSMTASLEERGLTGQIYADLVGDYIELWWHRAALEADIKARGVTVMDVKRGLPVENCSVSARVRVSAQMGKIYKDLGCKGLADQEEW